jgi:hypothetical protein
MEFFFYRNRFKKTVAVFILLVVQNETYCLFRFFCGSAVLVPEI